MQHGFFIFYSEAANHYWVMPSLEVAKLANRTKSGKAIGRYRIVFTNTTVKGLVRPRPKWEAWRDKFELLEHAHQAHSTKLGAGPTAPTAA